MAEWLAGQLNTPGSPVRNLVEYGVVWQLEVHVTPAERLRYSLDFRTPRLSLKKGGDDRASLFTHVAGEKLLATVRGSYHPDLLFTLGDTRYYEKIVGVRDGKCWAPPVQGWKLFEALPDPLVYYLRRYAPHA